MTLAPTATDRGTETRRRILEVAAEAFADRGYAGTSLSDVLKASGVTKGGFYFHFPSKEALGLAALRDQHEHDPACRAISRLCTELGDEHPELRPELGTQLTTWMDLVAALLRRGQDEGDIRPDVEPEIAAEVAVESFIGLETVAEVLTGRADLRRRAHNFRDLWFAAIRQAS